MDALFETTESPLVAGLNPHQAQAVVHAGTPLLIMAGAGSGKTRVLTHRIAYLLESGRARPHEILAITFTNKAAGEMRERVSALVGPEARFMWVSTFHSACVRMLRADHELAGLSSSFSIYDTADAVNLMKLVMRELDLDPKKFTPKAILGRIGRFKDELISPQVALAAADSREPPQHRARRGHRVPRVSAPARGGQRGGLRRHHRQGRAPPPGQRRGRPPLSRALPPHPG